MAKTASFKCSVVTPERSVLECEADFVAFPAHDGEIGILRNRAPLICRMGIGILRLHTSDGQRDVFVDGGFAQVHGNQLTLLTGQARDAAEITMDGANQAIVEARALPAHDESSAAARTKAVRRAKLQLKLVQRDTHSTR